MEEHEKILIDQFLAENWALFLGFCYARGVTSEEAEQLAEHLASDL